MQEFKKLKAFLSNMDNAQLLEQIRAEMVLLREKVESLKKVHGQEDLFAALEDEIEKAGYIVNDPFDISVWTPLINAGDISLKLGIFGALKKEGQFAHLEHHWMPPNYEPPEQPYCSKCAGEEDPFKGTEVYFRHGKQMTLYKSVDLGIDTIISEIEIFRKELVEIKARNS
jgi:hypothetical protein